MVDFQTGSEGKRLLSSVVVKKHSSERLEAIAPMHSDGIHRWNLN